MSQAYKSLVTGGTGYLASELIFQLLSRGNEVRTTVRSKESPKNAFLKSLQDEYPSKLELVEADLLQENDFDDAVKVIYFLFLI